jgi:hypothetical protein
MMKTTNEGPPPPKPARLDRPVIIGIRIDPISVNIEGGSR